MGTTMAFDYGTFLPEHNMVSSEWEKNQLIRDAHDRARAAILPRLIAALENHVGTGVWLRSTEIFPSRLPSELWTNADYYTVHDAAVFAKHDCPTTASTTTQFFLVREDERSVGKTKPRKRLSSNCLLRHDFSTGCDWFQVCKLRRRHQKEISKLPPVSSSLSSFSQSHAPFSSSILDELARSAVLKYFKTNRGRSGENKPNKTSENNKNIPIEDIESPAKGTTTAVDTIPKHNHDAEEDSSGDQPAKPESILMLRAELKPIVSEALSMVHAAENLEIGVVPRTTTVRWKEEDEFEVRFFAS